MAKPPKPAQLTAEPEATFVYDGAGDIYRPLRLLRDRYVMNGQAESARRVSLLIPSEYAPLSLGSGVLYSGDTKLGDVANVEFSGVNPAVCAYNQ